MPKYSEKSKGRLLTVKTPLQKVFNFVIDYFDNTISEGIRTLSKQRQYVQEGRSKTLNSKHLTGEAIDSYPYPIRMPKKGTKSFIKDLARFYYYAGFVLGVAAAMGVKLRWGGDWDMDTEVNDQTFDDLPHFELKED